MEGTPIIFVTAISKEDQYASRAANIGAVDYIFKPINADILRSKVKVYLDLYVQREQIMRLNSVLTQSNEELERFAYICSHDMQEPVRMMYSYSEILEQDYAANLDEEAQKYLKFIASSAHHMQKMVSDILTFSRIGRETPALERVDCNEILAEALEKFEEIIVRKKAKIVHEELPVLQACPTLMRILLQNLIGNALKFQDGGRVPEIVIGVQQKGNGWEFSVRDNGIGIDPAFHEKVFAIFQRYHRKEDYPGTGIGLSTCKKFLEIYGGTIRFESAPWQGTCFYFFIPYNQGENA